MTKVACNLVESEELVLLFQLRLKNNDDKVVANYQSNH